MTRARRRAALALLCIPFLAARAEAIVGGSLVPGSEANAVVMVLTMGGAGQCSGTLIAPSVVLTAASCLPDLVATNYQVLGGADPFSAPLFTSAVSAVHRHPDYDEQTFAHNVGVLELTSAPSPPVTPLPWLAADEGLYATGLSASFLGYGVTDAVTQNGSGLRRGGVAPITTHDADTFAIDATLGQSPCAGDSGGPALPAESVTGDIVMGVTSYGDQDCASYAVFARTDANASFIALYAPEPTAGAETSAAFLALAFAGGSGASRRSRASASRSATR